MKFSISTKKNQQTKAQAEVLCVGQGSLKSKTLALLGKKNNDLIAALATLAIDSDKKSFQAAPAVDT
ncbi:MAG: hypothetical protein J5680_05335, partial [Neisseriaceae bacterium]|nr:hypothetical protein [Neisseriaceae bacterium]